MEWITSLKQALKYIEENLLEEITIEDIARQVFMSPFYFQKGFKVLTEVSVSEYIRNRRLYLAALDLLSQNQKVIDIAFKYGYETPESFSKAFRRFHGSSPMQLKGDVNKVKVYLPLKISITISGGCDMDVSIEDKPEFKIIGFKKEFSFEEAYDQIPKYWNEFMHKYSKKEFKTDVLQAILENKVSEFGISISDCDEHNTFCYLIAGTYMGGKVGENMEVINIPALKWAVFKCFGPLPGALQSVNTQIYKDWLPGNSTYEIACGINIEWYSCANTHSNEYQSEIWIPVKLKDK